MLFRNVVPERLFFMVWTFNNGADTQATILFSWFIQPNMSFEHVHGLHQNCYNLSTKISTERYGWSLRHGKNYFPKVFTSVEGLQHS